VSEAVEALVPAQGWGVLHLFFRLAGDRREPIDLSDATALVAAFVGEEPYQAHWSATLGQKADIGLVLIGPDIVRLQRFHRDLLATCLGARLSDVPALGFVWPSTRRWATSRVSSRCAMRGCTRACRRSA
jgi:peroxiredoxin